MTLRHQDGLKSSIEALSRPSSPKHYPRDNQARSRKLRDDDFSQEEQEVVRKFLENENNC